MRCAERVAQPGEAARWGRFESAEWEFAAECPMQQGVEQFLAALFSGLTREGGGSDLLDPSRELLLHH